MGLDWKPIPKPAKDQERRFEEVFLTLTDPLFKPDASTDALLQEFADLARISPYETLRAPMVGQDAAADLWVKQMYEAKRLTPVLMKMSLAEATQEMKGFYVLALVEENDGLPVYCNEAAASGDYLPERTWFRASFLEACEDVIGPDVLADAYQSKMASAVVDYGLELQRRAESYAKTNNVERVLKTRSSDWDDESSPEAQAHIASSAAKWCLFWGQRGHGCEADF